MLTFRNEDAYKVVGGEEGKRLEKEGFDFLPFGSLEEEVRKDVEWLRGEKVVKSKGEKVSGWVYEVETGKVRKVV